MSDEKIIPSYQFLKGIRLCRRNAKSLLALANDAFEKECYHSAFLLGFASLEESGKAIIILDYINEENITFEQYRYELKNHKKKVKKALITSRYNMVEIYARSPRGAVRH